jgi:hypothetical protein
MWFHVTAVGSDGVERGAWVVDAESAADARAKGQREVANSDTMPIDDYRFDVYRCTVAGRPL